MDKNRKPELMVMTLGGSVEPLKKSLSAHRPEQIIFLASHDSVPLSQEVLKALDYKPVVHFEITEDPNKMLECYKKARNCIDRAKRSGILKEAILVDYTGGTKVMTAALILAAVGNSYRFHYVGGRVRTKNGVGVVVDGKEEFFEEMSPWSLFAEEERRQVITLFNGRNFAGAVEIIRSACERTLPPEIRSYFQFLLPLCEGFSSLDQFQHKEAHHHLKEGVDLLSLHLENHPVAELTTFREKIETCLRFINALLHDTLGLQRFHRILLDDLLNNARRRIADGRFDDASARIYRALELYGQIVFTEATGLKNDGVPPEAVPLEIKDTFSCKYLDSDTGKLKLPLSATFEFLKAKGHPAGITFFEKMEEMKKIQSSRNKSILAHGIQPVTEKGVRSLFSTVWEFVGAKESFDFPKLSENEAAAFEKKGECQPKRLGS